MQRLIFFDIDGTLAYPGQEPSASTVAAIHAARRNGHKVFISTGRTMDSIPASIASIGLTAAFSVPAASLCLTIRS